MPDNPVGAYVLLGVVIAGFIGAIIFVIWQKSRFEYPEGRRFTVKRGGHRVDMVFTDHGVGNEETEDDKMQLLAEACHEGVVSLADALIAWGAKIRDVKKRLGHVVVQFEYDEEFMKRPKAENMNATQGWIRNGPPILLIKMSFWEHELKTGSLVIHEALHAWLRWDSFHQAPNDLWQDPADGDPLDDVEEKAQAAFQSPLAA